MNPEVKPRPIYLITPDLMVRVRLRRSRDLWRAIAIGMVLGIAMGAVWLALRAA